MRLGPKSLAGQMLLLVAVALLAAQAINFALLLGEARGRRGNFIEGLAIAHTLGTLERVQSGLPVAGGPNRGPGRLKVSLGAAASHDGPRNVALENRIEQALQAAGYQIRAIETSTISVATGPDQLLVAVWLADGRWVNLMMDLPPGDAGLILRLGGQTLILLLAMLVVAMLVGRNVARPLSRLNKATIAFSENQQMNSIPLEGAHDVRQLIETFNLMQARIVDMLEEKDRMLGAIGHDLRTPLASLRLRAEAVDDEGERQRMVETLNEMGRTIDEILSLSRLGKSSEAPVRVDLSALLDALVQDLQDLGQPVALESGERLLATVRPVLIRRGLRNLIENAVKYGGTAEVRLFRADGEAIVEIDDRGPGIPEGELDRVLDGFVRLEGSRSRKTGGAGLGLTIAKAIIKQHGGTLRLQNLAGGGLRVSVCLPIEKGH